MKVVFISPLGQPLARWLQAFPDLTMQPSTRAYLAKSHHQGDVCFLDINGFDLATIQREIRQLHDEGAVVVAMSAMPEDSEAFALLTEGAKGYCHVEAVPEQIREVAAVVTAGGFWMPPGLVQRLLSTALRVSPQLPQPSPEGFDQLTEREYEVAKAVGKGANNKEIAEALEVSERTVKAHLTSIFEKLGLRDRVQLALAVNRLPIH